MIYTAVCSFTYFINRVSILLFDKAWDHKSFVFVFKSRGLEACAMKVDSDPFDLFLELYLPSRLTTLKSDKDMTG